MMLVMTRNDGKIVDILLSIINPVKQTYTNITRDVEDKSKSYVYQKESIQKLTKENKFLRKRLLEQKHYIKQVRDLYRRIPSLERIPRRSVEIVQAISYVKLNSFSQVILTKPEGLQGDKKRLYGLIQGNVAAGVAHIHNNNLYGALTSNNKCRFSVFVGENRAAGIVIGIDAKEMYVKFIPKWAEIKKGDKVVTSGLDTIFFADIPVGVVDRVEIESSYKIAYIRAYADVLHPDYFYLIKDPLVTLTSKFDGRYISDCNCSDSNRSTEDQNQTFPTIASLDEMLNPAISSIPSVLPEENKTVTQTVEEEVSSEQMQPPAEAIQQPVAAIRQPVKKRKKPKARPKVENLDMF